MRNFTQYGGQTEPMPDFEQLLDIALWEDMQTVGDLTCLAFVPESAQGTAKVVARSSGILAGLLLIPNILSAVNPKLDWDATLEDGAEIASGTAIGTIRGPARGMLTAERLILNFLGRLSGIASLTKMYVDAIRGTKARIYDTRKTTPGWRWLEKYAVACGGGMNHRTGLYDAVLIKDNHLALGRQDDSFFSPVEAVLRAKDFLRQRFAEQPDANIPIVQIEVDTLNQLRDILPAEPDIVLLDNMSLEQLTEAVRIRDAFSGGIDPPNVQLEASGGITLATVRDVAETGVERISVGALTHSATSLDFGLDWD